MMNKREVIKEFWKQIGDTIPKNDKPMIREAFNDYTDMLCKDKRITMKTYETIILEVK